jgi:hypothetical protein
MIEGKVILEYTTKEIFTGGAYLYTDTWAEICFSHWSEMAEKLKERGYDDKLIAQVKETDPGEMGAYIYVDPEEILLENGNERFKAGDKLVFKVPYEFYEDEYLEDLK